jgi:hypothetical protein
MRYRNYFEVRDSKYENSFWGDWGDWNNLWLPIIQGLLVVAMFVGLAVLSSRFGGV